MAPRRQKGVNERGYLFCFPPLGLPDPAGGWVTLKAGVGKREECSALLRNASTQPALRTPEGEYRVLELEHLGYVWFLPFLKPLNPRASEVFTVKVRRGLVTAVASGCERRALDEPEARYIFLDDPSGPMPDWPPLPTTKEASREDSQLFDTCLNPSPADCQDVVKQHCAEVPDRVDEEKEQRERAKAWRRWAAMNLDSVNEGWLRELHRNAVKAGLRKLATFNKNEQTIRLRPQAAYHYDVRCLEYAICQEDGEIAKGAEWKPLPQSAYSQDFVRCTVNLIRKECSQKLFAREQWPPTAARGLDEDGLEG